MNYPKTLITISSFAIALLTGVSLSTTHAYASEMANPLVNTAFAKEATADVLTIEQRIAILKEIVAASQDEITSLNAKIKELKFDKQWSIAQDHFINTLATSSDYYTKLAKRLDQENVSLEEVQLIAKELKDWRESSYTPQLKEVGNLILIFQIENVRDIVQARNVKISNDLKKLDRQKLVNTETLKKYLSQAEKSIKNATTLNDKAKDLYFITSISPLQPKDELRTAKVQLLEDILVKEESTSGSVTEGNMTSADGPLPDVQDEIRDLSKEALKELKTAYELFFKMNDRIRK